jgi:hypothetical protein
MQRRLMFFALLIAASTASAAAPYDPPWQLRGIAPARSVRLDTSLTSNKTATGEDAITTVQFLSAAVPFGTWVPFIRLGLIETATPAVSGVAITAPALGVNKLFDAGPFRFAATLIAVLPVGTGGGDTPPRGPKTAIGSGAQARFGMDNAMFGINDFSLAPGLSAALIQNGFTLQAEATVIQYFRVRGEQAQSDVFKTNFASGVHAGYFVVPQLSLSLELHYQRFLSTPASVKADPSGNLRDALSLTAGVRGHFTLGPLKFRPGLAYVAGLDEPLFSRRYQMVQLDLLFAY